MAGVCASVLAGAFGGPAQAQTQTLPYLKADGTRTADLETAAQSWREDEEFIKTRALDRLNAEYAYASGVTGKGARIGIMDGGGYADHTEFDRSRLFNVSVEGKYDIDIATLGGVPVVRKGDPFVANGLWDGGDVKEPNGGSHATMTIGTIAAKRDGENVHGVAFESTVYAARSGEMFLTNDRQGSLDNDHKEQKEKDPEIFRKSMEALVQSGAQVILGEWQLQPRPLTNPDGTPATPQNQGAVFDLKRQYESGEGGKILTAMEDAAKAGIVHVVAAGNFSAGTPHIGAALPYFKPELEKNWIAAAAGNQNRDELASYSNSCSVARYYCIVAADLMYAPSSKVANGKVASTYADYNGTSGASAEIAGAMGLVLSRYPYLQPWQAREVLLTTARDVGSKGVDKDFGWGFVDLKKAMNGPGQFLGRFEAHLPTGTSDTWSNDISDEALQQRRKEEDKAVAWQRDAAGMEAVRNEIADSLPEAQALIDKYLEAMAAFRNRTVSYVTVIDAQGKMNASALAKYIYGKHRENHRSELEKDDVKAAVIEAFEASWADDAEIEHAAAKARRDHFGSSLYDAGLTKLGGGTLRLTGNSTYRGDTLVDGGLLAVDGSLVSAVTVNDGGTLGGTGRVGGLHAKAGGTVAPGNSIGTLSVAGDASFDANSRLHIEVAADGRSDRLAVTGQATILGGVLTITPENGSGALSPAETLALLGKSYTMLTADGGISGRFDKIEPGYVFIGATASYDASAVSVTLARNGVTFADAGSGANGKASGAAIEALGSGNALYDRMLVSVPADDVAARLGELSGDIHGTVRGVLLEDGRFVREAALARLREAGSAGVAGAPGPWGHGYGSWGTIGSDGNALAAERSVGGFVGGLDGVVAGDWRLGMLAGYARSEVTAGTGKADADSYQLGLYGGTSWQGLDLAFGAAYGRHDVDTRRSPRFDPTVETASYGADSMQLFGEAGYNIATSLVELQPFAGLAYSHLWTGDFAEKGGIAALSGAAGTEGVATTTLGLRAASSFDLAGMATTVSGMVGWRHALGDTTPEARLSFAGGDLFSSQGLPVARDALALEAGIGVKLSGTANLGISYNGQVAERANDHGVKARLNLSF